MEHGKISISVAMHPHSGFDVMAAMPICRNLQDQFLEADTVVVAYRALMLFAQMSPRLPPIHGTKAEPSSDAGQANSALNAGIYQNDRATSTYVNFGPLRHPRF
ncbi:MAG: hypothetical protein HY306_13045 [Nitrosomonadales bacterium]|nr:hypothetical protein [Nitrosomonadales bacterium]